MLSDAESAGVVARVEAVVPIDALWIFGSEARDQVHPESDVDIAVLFSRPPSGDEIQTIRAALVEVLARDADVVDLGKASPVVARQVLLGGRLVAERSRSRRVAFTAALPARYEDLMLVRRPVEAALLRRVADG